MCFKTKDNFNLTENSIDTDTLSFNHEQRPEIFRSFTHECLSVFLCIFGPAAATMASSSYQTMLKDISKEFNIEGGILTWSVSSVMLANGSCLLLMGGISDAFGRKNAMFLGFIMYAIFSLICGFMHNYTLLCLFRGLQGASVACATPASAGFLGSVYLDSKRKNFVMSCFGLGSPVGGACGFFLAGVCIVCLNWRAVQFFFSILFGILSILVYIFIPNDDNSKINWSHSKHIFKKLDYIGALISLTSFVLIIFSLTNVDATEKRCKTPYIITLLVIGVTLLPIFVIYEIFIPSEPLMPMKLFKNINFCICMVIASLSWMTFFGVLNYNTIIYFEDIKGYSAIIVACCFITQPIVGITVNLFAGLTMHIIPGKILVSIGCLGFVGATIIWATISASRNYFLGPFWGFILLTIGADLIYNVANRVTLSALTKESQSRGAGTFNTIIQISSAVGLGFNSAIMISKYSNYGTPLQNADKISLLAGMKYTYYFGIAITGFSFLLSLFLKVGVVGKI